MRTSLAVALSGFSLLVSVALACSSTSGTQTKGSVSVSNTGDVTYTGTWLSQNGVGGSEVLELQQDEGTVTGTVTFTNSPCFSSGSVSGTTTDGTAINATITAGGIEVTFEGTITGDQISGTYTAVSAGACTGDKGTFNLTE